MDGQVRAGRSVPLRAGDGRIRPAPAREKGRTTARSRSSARTAARRDRRRRAFRGLGAERRARQRGRRLQPLGRPRHPMRRLGATGIWELFVPGLGDGERYKFEIRDAARARCSSRADPYGVRVRGAAATRRRSSATSRDYAWQRRRRGWRDAPDAQRLARSADVDLRGAPRLVGARARGGQPFLTYRELGRAGWCLRQGDGLHAHRAAAGDRASVRRIVGLPGARLLRADQPLRLAGRFQATSSTPATRPASA